MNTIRPVIESVLIHATLVVGIFVAANITGGNGKSAGTTSVLQISTSIISGGAQHTAVVEAAPIEVSAPEPVPVVPVKPIKQKAKVVKPIEKSVIKNEPVVQKSVQKTETIEPVEAYVSAQGNDNATVARNVATTDEMGGGGLQVASVANSAGTGSGIGIGAGTSIDGDASGGTGVYALRDVEQKPKLLDRVKPDYPKYAKDNRIEGSVTLSFILDKSGNITDVTVVKSTPENVFENAALAAVKRWKFSPSQKNGEAVNTRMMVALRFKLDEY